MRRTVKALFLDGLTWSFSGALALVMALGWSAESTVHGMWTSMGKPLPPLWIRILRDRMKTKPKS